MWSNFSERFISKRGIFGQKNGQRFFSPEPRFPVRTHPASGLEA